MYGLSERLSLIASLVPDGAAVCDVGTDHGYLAAALYKSGRVKSVIATDIKEKPLEKAVENLKRLNADSIKLVLCDGLSGISKGEADTVIIAGMGGEVISGILDRADWLKSASVALVLQPMTSAWKLRQYLFENGFKIISEPTLEENGKVYSVMLAGFDGNKRDYDMFDCCIGKIGNNKPSDIAYIKKQYARCNRCALKLENLPDKQKEYIEYRTTALKLKNILEEHNAI